MRALAVGLVVAVAACSCSSSAGPARSAGTTSTAAGPPPSLVVSPTTAAPPVTGRARTLRFDAAALLAGEDVRAGLNAWGFPPWWPLPPSIGDGTVGRVEVELDAVAGTQRRRTLWSVTGPDVGAVFDEWSRRFPGIVADGAFAAAPSPFDGRSLRGGTADAVAAADGRIALQVVRSAGTGGWIVSIDQQAAGGAPPGGLAVGFPPAVLDGLPLGPDAEVIASSARAFSSFGDAGTFELQVRARSAAAWPAVRDAMVGWAAARPTIGGMAVAATVVGPASATESGRVEVKITVPFR